MDRLRIQLQKKLLSGVVRRRTRMWGAVLLLAPLFVFPAEIGSRIADFTLPDTSGTNHTLLSYAGKVVVLCFWSFKCPTALSYDDRLAGLQKKHETDGVVFLGIASNSNESPEEIRRNVENLKLPFAILLDSNGLLAERLGPTHTPGIFILDRKGTLRYAGAFDNNRNPGASGRIAYAEHALESILREQPVAVPETKAFGCSLKKKSAQ